MTNLTHSYPTNLDTTHEPAHQSVEILLNMWTHGKAGTTIQSYKRVANKFILSLKGKPLLNAGLYDIQQFLSELRLSDNSLKTYTSIIKSLISFLHELGVMPLNVAKPIKTKKPKDALNERILTKHEISQMIEAAEGRNKLVLKCLYFLGLRASELCDLKWSDIRGDKLTIYGKGSKTRTILIPEALLSELRTLRNSTEYIFSSRQSACITRNTVWNIVKTAARAIGLKNPSPHWLRHGHATHALENGAPIHLVSASLGHASVSTTSRYLHANPKESSSLFLSI